MKTHTQDITVRSISVDTRSRLDALQAYSRLTFGSLIDDAIELLWADYLSDGHDVAIRPQTATIAEAA